VGLAEVTKVSVAVAVEEAYLFVLIPSGTNLGFNCIWISYRKEYWASSEMGSPAVLLSSRVFIVGWAGCNANAAFLVEVVHDPEKPG
jgi:hypothetical protein